MVDTRRSSASSKRPCRSPPLSESKRAKVEVSSEGCPNFAESAPAADHVDQNPPSDPLAVDPAKESEGCDAAVAAAEKSTDALVESGVEPSPSSLDARYQEECIFTYSLIIVTCVCILAVDFKVYPKRYAKTETYGTGLMDLGVGLFVVENALVSRQARNITSVKWRATIRSVSPLLVLGFGRLIFTAGVDYQVLAILMLSGLIHGPKTSLLEEACNQNLLGLLVLSNILTGVINLYVDTLSASLQLLFSILVGYALVLFVFAGVARYAGIKLKFW